MPFASTRFSFTLESIATLVRSLPLVGVLLFFIFNIRADDWPQFLGPTRDGVYRGKELAAKWPAAGPRKVWERSVGPGFSGPVVVEDKLVLFHRVADEELVECLNATSGKPLWTFRYPTDYRDDMGMDEGPRATPTVSDGKVFAFGAAGILTCVDLASGRKHWSVDTKATFKPAKVFFGPACSPLVEGNLVILNVGGAGGAGIVAFDKSSGRVAWKATDHEASHSSPVASTIAGNRLALVLTRAGLVALAPDSGAVRFEFPFRPPMHASVSAAAPIVVGDRIFLSASYGAGAVLLQVKGNRAEKVWSGDDILSNHYATSVYKDGYLYGFEGRQEQGCTLRCVEWATGKVRWSHERLGAGTVTLGGAHLLVLTENGELLRAPASPDGFKPADRAQVLPFQVRAYPALANGLFYARSKDKLVCVDLGSR